jgi:hypothetical protein
MAKVSHHWAPGSGDLGLYQAAGPAYWEWDLGDGQHYWAFSIRPQRGWGDVEVEVVRQWTAIGDRLLQTEHFEVDVRTAVDCLLMFNAIKVEEA